MISLVSVFLTFAALVLTGFSVPLKFFGLLAVSWWAALCPIPVVLTVSLVAFAFTETRWAKDRGITWD